MNERQRKRSFSAQCWGSRTSYTSLSCLMRLAWGTARLRHTRSLPFLGDRGIHLHFFRFPTYSGEHRPSSPSINQQHHGFISISSIYFSVLDIYSSLRSSTGAAASLRWRRSQQQDSSFLLVSSRSSSHSQELHDEISCRPYLSAYDNAHPW